MCEVHLFLETHLTLDILHMEATKMTRNVDLSLKGHVYMCVYMYNNKVILIYKISANKDYFALSVALNNLQILNKILIKRERSFSNNLGR